MGLGRRTFAPGEVLTASNVMNYLQDQAVMSFAGTAARGSAIGTAVQEGMVSYLQDLNQVQVYDGSDWKRVYPSVANAGEVVQVVTATTSTLTTTTSTTFVTANLSASITPSATSSKILAIVSAAGRISASDKAHYTTLFRGTVAGTNLGNGNNGFNMFFTQSGGLNQQTISFSYLDSPATTSATTYTVGFRADTPATANINYGLSTIILLEVLA